MKGATLFVYVTSIPSLSIIPGDNLRPDLADSNVYFVELTFGFVNNV